MTNPAKKNEFTLEQEQWLEALERDEYPQVQGALRTSNGFCCLGVACEVVHFPNRQIENSIMFGYGDSMEETQLSIHSLPDEVAQLLHIKYMDGRLKEPDHPAVKALNKSDYQSIESLAHFNDRACLTFPEIAAFIRAYPWQIFDNFEGK